MGLLVIIFKFGLNFFLGVEISDKNYIKCKLKNEISFKLQNFAFNPNNF